MLRKGTYRVLSANVGAAAQAINKAAIPAQAREKYNRLIPVTQKQATVTVAVAHPCDDISLRGAIEAKRLGLIEPILVGPVELLRAVACRRASTSARSTLRHRSTS